LRIIAPIAEAAQRRLATVAVAATGAMMIAPEALAHASISPPVAQTSTLQQFTLEVQAEKEGPKTTTVEMTVPDRFNIESFANTPGWERRITAQGSGEEAHAQHVVWTGVEGSARDDPVFHFTGTLEWPKTYGVKIRQVYTDGSLVDWDGPADSEEPAAYVKGVSSIGGGGRTTLTIVALVLAGIGVLIAVVGLVGRAGGRPIA
jgi:uncharacterized protein YcnI